jgi:hypothetical protein
MKLQYSSILIGLVILGTACDKPKDNAPPPVRDEDNPIMQIPESYADKDGLVSLTFDIEKFIDPKQFGQDATFMELKGRHKYTVMQFNVTVGRPVQKVPFSSMGGGGDQFLQVLDELFETKAKPRSMHPSTLFEQEPIEGDPTKLDKGPATLKMKHANGAQFLLIVDMKAKKVEIREVNKNFRRQILQAFTF